MSEATLTLLTRKRSTAALFGWNPFMHNPSWPGACGGSDVPSLVLWGESDRVVTPDYGRAFADAHPRRRVPDHRPSRATTRIWSSRTRSSRWWTSFLNQTKE